LGRQSGATYKPEFTFFLRLPHGSSGSAGYQKATIDIVDVWERRPLMRELLQFTVAEISGLLPLARLLQDDVKVLSLLNVSHPSK